MKKNILILFFTFFTTHILYGQSTRCKISGMLINDSHYKYAYLSLEKTKPPIITSIVNGKFQFNVTTLNESVLGIIFFGMDSLRTYNDIIKDSRMGIPNARSIVIEDLEMSVPEDLSKAIVKGGTLNKDYDEMNITIHTKDYKLYFEQHPDSPISMSFLTALVHINKMSMSDLPNFDGKALFSNLSDRLKNSIKGKKLWEDINN